MFSDQFGSADLDDRGAKFFCLRWADAVDLEKLARIAGTSEGYGGECSVVQDAVGWDAQALCFTGAPLFESCGECCSVGG